MWKLGSGAAVAVRGSAIRLTIAASVLNVVFIGFTSMRVIIKCTLLDCVKIQAVLSSHFTAYHVTAVCPISPCAQEGVLHNCDPN